MYFFIKNMCLSGRLIKLFTLILVKRTQRKSKFWYDSTKIEIVI